MNLIQQVKNFLFTPNNTPGKRTGDGKRNLSNTIAPVQLQRIRQDFQSWREAVNEAELAWYPQRVKMQRIFVDTGLNGHVEACMQHRKDLTLLRDYKLCDVAGKEDEKVGLLFKQQQWFSNFVSYALDAQAYGYTLVSLGDLINDSFPELSTIRRWNISPDRFNVTVFVYSLTGTDFRKDPFRLWHVYAPTPSENGVSPSGYGYLYKVALYEIVCRNLLGQNVTFTELYSQPYRVGHTPKTTEDERQDMADALTNMGSNGWAVVDIDETIEFIETRLGGNGWMGYENLEKRCEAKISKIILGHADALDSVPGKLGNDGEESPAEKAKKAKQAHDSKFIETLVNEELIPRMREMGINIPEDLHFEYKNDDEKQEVRQKEDKSNQATALIAKTMKDAGLEMNAEYFTERTGIPAKKIEAPVPVVGKSIDDGQEEEGTEDEPDEDDKELPIKTKLTKKVKNTLEALYSHKHID